MNWVDEHIENYFKWLKDNTISIIDSQSGWTMINTPFMGIFNDGIEIYAKKEKHKIILSDDGVTLKNLELSGVSIFRSTTRKELLQNVLRNHGVTLINNELTIEANKNNFCQKKHNFLSALMELNDFEILAKHNVSSMFKDDIREYLDDNQVIYTPDFIYRGATGLEFTFDFQMMYQKKEVIVKSFNTINKSNLTSFLFSWNDVSEFRREKIKKEVIGLAIINDTSNSIKPEYIDALKQKGSDFILWSGRNLKESIKKLSA